MSKKSSRKIQSVDFVENVAEFVNPAAIVAAVEGEVVAPVPHCEELEPIAAPVATQPRSISNRRFENGALWVYTNANSPENPEMQIIVDAERNNIGFVCNEGIAKFICLAATDSANRIIAQLTARQESTIVNSQGNKIKKN